MDARSLILRDLLRHYTSFKDYAASPDGSFFISHRGITISFVDLQGSFKLISPRKKEAVYYNVVHDMLQRETAEIMGIKTVTVGQYVEQAMIQIGRKFWTDDDVLSVSAHRTIYQNAMEHAQAKADREKAYAKARRTGLVGPAQAPSGVTPNVA